MMSNIKKRAYFGGRSPRTKDSYERQVVSKTEIEAGLDKSIPRILKGLNRIGGTIPGLRLMPEIGVDFIEIGSAKFPYLETEKASQLVALAKTNCHAFDLAQYIAGMQIAALKVTGVDICPSLTNFGAMVLNGEVIRPPQRERWLGKSEQVS